MEPGYLSLYKDLATGWAIEELSFDSSKGQEIFLFSTANRLALGPDEYKGFSPEDEAAGVESLPLTFT
jgi:hypothetical protein